MTDRYVAEGGDELQRLLAEFQTRSQAVMVDAMVAADAQGCGVRVRTIWTQEGIIRTVASIDPDLPRGRLEHTDPAGTLTVTEIPT